MDPNETRKIPTAVERTAKESHLDTIWYEIEMLQYCYFTFENERPEKTDPNWNLLIEGFLLHYRNLIQFYAGNEGRHKRYKNDLTTFAPEVWAARLLTDQELKDIKTPGHTLDKNYSGEISIYMQHCTLERADIRTNWDLQKMFGEIDEINAHFKKSFPKKKRRGETDATPAFTTQLVSNFESVGTSSVSQLNKRRL
jgi:hypothetical protein